MIDIKLSLRRLKKQIKYNKLIVLFLIISSVLSILFFTSLFVRYMPQFNDRRENNTKYRFYNIIFSKSLNDNDLKLLEKNLPDLDSFKITNVKIKENVYNEDDEKLYFSTFLHETPFINEIELKNSSIDKFSKLGNNEVLIPLSYNLKKDNKFLKINGINLKVIGYWEGVDFLVSSETYLSNFEINQIVFRTKKVLNTTDLNDLNKLFFNYPIQSISSPVDAYEKDTSLSPTVMIIINIIYILSIISYSSIFWVLMRFLEKDFRIYRMVGMTKLRIFVGILLDVFVFIVISTLIAFGIHELMWNSFFSRTNNFLAGKIEIKDYLIIFILIIVLSFTIISPYLYKLFKDIINKKKEID
ncbi:FtsX-like permease family protein [Helcococcus bovis]|uniref:FtsX-like permease family protein n=1 Tax=Helcococcus bovis TaxID=3153252 RepID=UPI0038B837E1